MKKKTSGAPPVCLNFCTYYKPGKNEDLQCQGFVVVQGLIKRGKQFSQHKPGIPAIPDAEAKEGLRQRVCLVCSFHAEDCDFILTNGNAPPCGGYLLLSHLLGSGDLLPDDLG